MMRKIPTLIPGEAGYELQLQHDAAVLQKHGDLCTDALIELCSEDVLTPYLHTLRADLGKVARATDVSHARNHGCVKRDEPP